ncbi:programmed cell death 1 ligand 1 [Xenopus laevis]|uniref:Programmed cell death 1 ligand 1 n=1 Tax=Xenopus laevis TaxID=8355 RepID=A0A8J0U6S5_XENLA|nr:programmed cell death 1 ligand 1 [Xenopus laevis]
MQRRLISAILFLFHGRVLSALFTVEAARSHYTAEYGGKVNMECHFQVGQNTNVDDVEVYWEYIAADGRRKEVIKLIKGTENLSAQHEDYRGRVRIIKEELYKGHAVLQISNVMLTDSGRYICIISAKGSDYKSMGLTVQAHYREINTRVTDIMASPAKMVKQIECQSIGYPEAEVTWFHAEKNLSSLVNTSYIVTAAKLFNVTSVVRVSSFTNNTFTCMFWNGAFQEATVLTFTIPDSDESHNTNKRSCQMSVTAVAVVAALCIFICVYIKQCGKLIS